MNKPLRITLIVVGAVAVVIVGGALAARSWIGSHREELLAVNRAGRAYGQGTAAARCVDEVLNRHARGTPSFGATLRESIFLDGCLQASDSVGALCATNADQSLLGQVKWINVLCRAKGLVDQYCANALQPLTKACRGTGSPPVT